MATAAAIELAKAAIASLQAWLNAVTPENPPTYHYLGF